MQFLISVIDDGQALAAGDEYSATPDEDAAIDAFNAGLERDGHWVFAAGVAAPASAVVIDARGAEPTLVDGPLVESVAYQAGFWIVDVPDEAHAREVAIAGSRACNRRVELRALLEPPA